MTNTEAAIAYCLSIGADPHEKVVGWITAYGRRDRIVKPRWQWYLGARP